MAFVEVVILEWFQLQYMNEIISNWDRGSWLLGKGGSCREVAISGSSTVIQLQNMILTILLHLFRVYVPCIYLLNKIDQISIEVRMLLPLLK